MNILKGKIAHIRTQGNISLVKVDSEGVLFSSIVIETPETASYLKLGTPIHVVFKETEVVLAKKLEQEISMLNRVQGVVKAIDDGKLLSKIQVETKVGKITAFITSEAVEALQLKLGEEICAMVQTTEIMLSE